MTASVGIVVLTHGRSTQAPELVAELLADGVPAQHVVVVHNPVRPDDPLPAVPAGVEIVRMDRNAGYAPAMNAGIRWHLARSVELVLTLTHELRFQPGALGLLLDAAAQAPQFGVLAPTLWWQERDCPLSYGGQRRARGGLNHIQTAPRTSEPIAETDWVDGTAVLYRAAALEAAGLLEERFFMYVEDAEICLRVQEAGWRVGVVPASRASSSPGSDTRPGAWTYLATRNGLEYSRRALGARGVMWELARRGRESVELSLAYARARHDAPRRARCLLELRATGSGALDFFNGRWGPPPPSLAGSGDMIGTGADE